LLDVGKVRDLSPANMGVSAITPRVSRTRGVNVTQPRQGGSTLGGCERRDRGCVWDVSSREKQVRGRPEVSAADWPRRGPRKASSRTRATRRSNSARSVGKVEQRSVLSVVSPTFGSDAHEGRRFSGGYPVGAGVPACLAQRRSWSTPPGPTWGSSQYDIMACTAITKDTGADADGGEPWIKMATSSILQTGCSRGPDLLLGSGRARTNQELEA